MHVLWLLQRVVKKMNGFLVLNRRKTIPMQVSPLYASVPELFYFPLAVLILEG